MTMLCKTNGRLAKLVRIFGYSSMRTTLNARRYCRTRSVPSPSPSITWPTWKMMATFKKLEEHEICDSLHLRSEGMSNKIALINRRASMRMPYTKRIWNKLLSNAKWTQQGPLLTKCCWQIMDVNLHRNENAHEKSAPAADLTDPHRTISEFRHFIQQYNNTSAPPLMSSLKEDAKVNM